MAAKVHVAGKQGPRGGQPCSRCGEAIIEDPRGEMMTGAGDRRAPRAFAEGAEIVVVAGRGFRFCTGREGYEGVAEVCGPPPGRDADLGTCALCQRRQPVVSGSVPGPLFGTPVVGLVCADWQACAEVIRGRKGWAS